MDCLRKYSVGIFAAGFFVLLGGCPNNAVNQNPLAPGGTGGSPGDPSNPGGSGGANAAPVAGAVLSPATGVRPGQEVTLDGSTSSDPDGDALQFDWQQPAGPAVGIDGKDANVATFVTPFVVENTELQFRLTVRDGRGGESSAEVQLIVEVADEFAGHAQAVSAYRESLTSDEAYHLLRRAAFGAKPEDVQRAVQRGLSATVAELLDFRPMPAEVQALADSYEEDVERRWMVYMLEGPSPLQERLALFWHDRFATSRRVAGGGDQNLGVLHCEMLRANALGNYREFLRQLTLDPLMLIWLDGANSPKESPNENYAREFWELFTLGRDVLYTEDDIREASRAFTGITLLRRWPEDPRPIFDIRHHDETLKHVFPGRAEPANHDYEDLIDLTLAQPEAAEYVARNLFVAFVHDHPSQAVIDDLAATFVEARFELRPLVEKILTSQALFSPEARRIQVSSPLEHVVGVARTFDMHMHSEDSQGYVLYRLLNDLAEGGQEILNPPGVQGWDEQGWLQDQWVLSRVRALGDTMEYGPERTEDLPYHLLPPAERWAQRDVREEIVRAIAGVLHLAPSAEEVAIYVEVLDEGGWRAFHLQDERNQVRNVFEMIRLMAMHENVIVR